MGCRLLRQSTTVTVDLGPAVDKTDGVTEETGLSPTVYLSKESAAQAARNSATAISHDARGYYRVELNTTDTNTLGKLRAAFHDSATHLPVWETFMVIPANVYDSLIAGSDYLDVSMVQWLGTAPLALTSQRVETVVGAYASGQAPLQPTTAGRTLDVTATGAAGIDLANVENQGSTLALSATTVGTVTTLTGHTPQTGDAFARLGAPAGASVSADVAAVKTDTGGTATKLAGITLLRHWLGAIMGKQAADATALTEIRASGAGSGTYDPITDSGEAIRDAGATPADVATATMEKIVATHSGVAGSLAERISRIPNVAAGANGGLPLQGGAVPNANAGANGGLPTVNGSNYIAGMQGTINTLDALDTAQDAQHATTQGYLDTEIAAIISSLATIAGYLDTEVAAIKAKTDNLPADPADASDVAAAIIAARDVITALLPTSLSSGRLRVDVEAINASTAAAVRQALAAGTIIPGTVDTAGFSPTTTEFEADDITEATADHYNGRIIIFTSGALLGQATSISDYALATGRGHFTTPALTEAPANNGTFVII